MSQRLPKMFRVRQHFQGGVEQAPGFKVTAELERIRLQDRIRRDQTVAIAVGSRGIANLAEMVAATVRHVHAVGGKPFIVPAMGSHGGGTAIGQVGVLESLGVSSESVRCPVDATMETRVIGETKHGLPIHCDVRALEADHLILINRVKPHTNFAGRYQSGLLKMLMIGLGKRNGAELYHRATRTESFDGLIEEIIPKLLSARSVTIALAVIENALEQTYSVEAVEAKDLLEREPLLLEKAKSLMPRLPFDHADLLIIDQIGKNISGTGMDTNIIGRKQNDKQAGEDEYPKLRHIYVRGLTRATHGNAAGIGLAEFCRSQILDEIDYEATRINSLTAGHVIAAAIPMHFATDREVLEAAATQAGLATAQQLRWMWIKDTLHLTDVMCSEAYYRDAQLRDDLHLIGEPKQVEFDEAGQLKEAFAENSQPTSAYQTTTKDDVVG